MIIGMLLRIVTRRLFGHINSGGIVLSRCATRIPCGQPNGNGPVLSPWDQDGPCIICERSYDGACICPVCPECGETGDLLCYQEHGMVESAFQIASRHEALERYRREAEAESLMLDRLLIEVYGKSPHHVGVGLKKAGRQWQHSTEHRQLVAQLAIAAEKAFDKGEYEEAIDCLSSIDSDPEASVRLVLERME